eukprot:438215-Amphidinium_carterae.1
MSRSSSTKADSRDEADPAHSKADRFDPLVGWKESAPAPRPVSAGRTTLARRLPERAPATSRQG